MSEFYEPLDSVDKWEKRAQDFDSRGDLDPLEENDHPVLRSLGLARIITEHGRRISDNIEGEA